MNNDMATQVTTRRRVGGPLAADACEPFDTGGSEGGGAEGGSTAGVTTSTSTMNEILVAPDS